MKKPEQNHNTVRVPIPAISLDQEVYDAIVDAAAFNELSLKAEIVVTIKEAIRKKYKPKADRRGRAPGLPSQAILDELAALKATMHIEMRRDGGYVGVNAQASGVGWRVTAPPVLAGHRYTYLGSYRTQEEAAVVRGRAIREQRREELIRWKTEDDILSRAMEAMPDPNLAVPLRAPPTGYLPNRDRIDVDPDSVEPDASAFEPEPITEDELRRLMEPVELPPDPEEGKWS